jgi:hypothetical protein
MADDLVAGKWGIEEAVARLSAWSPATDRLPTRPGSPPSRAYLEYIEREARRRFDAGIR